MRPTKIKTNYERLSPVEVYKLVLSGKLKRFPVRTWNQPDSVEYAIEILQYLIKNILKWSDEDIKGKYSYKIFKDYRLRGLLYEVFSNSPFQALNAAYPGRFKEWELNSVPNHFWTKETIIETIKWLTEVKLKWSDEDVKNNFSQKTLEINNLESLLDCPLINGSAWRILEMVYPGRYKEWELVSTPKNFWTIETGIQAIKWLFDEKLRWTEEDIKKNLSVKIFNENGLRGVLKSLFMDSPFRALNAAYPGKFDSKDFHLWRKFED